MDIFSKSSKIAGLFLVYSVKICYNHVDWNSTPESWGTRRRNQDARDKAGDPGSLLPGPPGALGGPVCRSERRDKEDLI